MTLKNLMRSKIKKITNKTQKMKMSTLMIFFQTLTVQLKYLEPKKVLLKGKFLEYNGADKIFLKSMIQQKQAKLLKFLMISGFGHKESLDI